MMSSSKKNRRKQRIPRDSILKFTPPSLPPIYRGSTVIRYVKTSTANAVVNWASLAKLWIVANAATTGYSLWDAFKFQKVIVYCPGSLNTAVGGFQQSIFYLLISTACIDVASTSSVLAQDKALSATPGPQGAVLKFKAKPGSGYDFWMNAQNLISSANSSNFFTVAGPTGVIVDLHIAYQLGYDTSTAYAGVLGAGAGAGRTYLNYLDNSNTTGGAGTQLLQCQSAGTGNTTVAWN